MKKIAVINNDFQVPQRALDYAISIARHTEATIFGLFIHNLKYRDNEGYGFPNDMNLTDTDFTEASDEQEHLKYEQTAIAAFSKRCEAEHISYQAIPIHENHLDALTDHSAFSDLMIYDADATPAAYSKNSFLANAHCPVLLVNKDFKQVDHIVLTYDDKISGIHAIKNFAYLFSAYKSLPVHFVSVVHESVRGLEYEDLIAQWLPLHFPNATQEILKGDAAAELPDYINGLSNPLIVMGAFGRSSLSRFFKESLASVVLAKTNAPVFIAHY